MIKALLLALGCIFGSEGVGIIGALFTVSAIPTWYAQLQKPSFSPPNFIFAPVWTTLYLMIGLSAFFVLRKGWEKKQVHGAMAVFAIQLALNLWWSIIFFGLHMPVLALLDIVLLWIFIVVTMIRFFKVSETATFLLAPYLLWVTFAFALNYMIVILN